MLEAPTIRPRSDWGASNVIQSRLVPRTRAPQRAFIHHSADKWNSTDLNEIRAEIKRIQELHFNANKCDIAYHFIIDPAGRIWQGAEVDGYQRGGVPDYFDDINILVLGDFESRFLNGYNPDQLNVDQQNALVTLSKWVCYQYDLEVIPSGQDMAPISMHKTAYSETECPGDNLESWVSSVLIPTIENWRIS